MRTMDRFEKDLMKKGKRNFNIGDVVDVHVKITEGEKERVQIFSGTVIKIKGQGLTETFTVRRIVQGEGVERIFPIHAPRVVQIELKKQGKVRRAKLYYLRDRIGRATKVEEILDAKKKDAGSADDMVHTPPAAPAVKAVEDKPAEKKEAPVAKTPEPETSKKS